MNDFTLPIIRKTRNKKRMLSMDEYLEFIQFNLQNAFDKEGYEKWKKMLSVNVPFFIN
jgi:hypothetical protein